jgi:iron(III) transport system permease protein
VRPAAPVAAPFHAAKRIELRLDAQTVLLVALLGLVGYLVLPPLGILVQTSLYTTTPAGDLGDFTLDHYARLLGRGALVTPLLNSLWFSVGSAIFSVVLGTALAWIVERTNTPLRTLGHFAAFVSFAIPYVLYTVAWLLLLGKSGPINSLLKAGLGLAESPLNVFSLWGMVLVEGLLWSPLVFLMVAASLRSMDPSLEESAAASGANAWQTVRRVSLPLVLPSLFSVALLVAIRAFEAFEIPALVGLPGNVQVLTTRIYLGASRFPPQHGEASAFAIVLIVLVGAALYYYARLTSQANRFQTITGKGFRPRLIDLGRWRYATAAVLLTYVFVVLVVPFLMIAWTSFMPFNAIVSAEALSQATLQNYVKAAAYPKVTQAALNSVALGLGCAFVVMGLASLSSWLVVRGHAPARWVLEQLAAMPLVFPAIVLGLAILRLYVALPVPIYNTLWILLIAYVTRYLPYGARYSSSGMLQIHRELEEAAYISGASWWNAFRRVLLPLLSPAFWAGWIFVFLISLKELSMSVLLAGPRTPVISVAMFDLWNDGQVVEVAAFGVVWTALVAVVATLFFVVARRQGLQVR